MQCTVDEEKECDNIALAKCKDCIAPSWCFCTRAGANEDKSVIRQNRCKNRHRWKDGWICDKCGLRRADYEDAKKARCHENL